MRMMVFDFEEKAVRAFERDGQDWFVAMDVCRCLGIANNRDAVSRLPDDEKCEVNLNSTVGLTDGISAGNPNADVINEPGLYRLIFRSEKPEAERLKRWVFHEVLPQLRRTGSYAPEPDFEIIREKMAIVKETRLTLGRKAAALIWKDLGLPVAEEKPEPAAQERNGMLGHLLDFLDECTEKDGKSEVAAGMLYKRYQQWAPLNNAPFMTIVGFGKLMPKAGVNKRKTNSFFYTGIRLRHHAEAVTR